MTRLEKYRKMTGLPSGMTMCLLLSKLSCRRYGLPFLFGHLKCSKSAMFSVSPAYSKVRGGRRRVGRNMAAVRFGVLPGEHDEAREEGTGVDVSKGGLH